MTAIFSQGRAVQILGIVEHAHFAHFDLSQRAILSLFLIFLILLLHYHFGDFFQNISLRLLRLFLSYLRERPWSVLKLLGMAGVDVDV